MLPRSALIRTSELDQGAWNYGGVLGWVISRRLGLVDRLLAGVESGRLLEVGYGSGVFMPTLTRHCTVLDGIDVHEHPEQVMRVLAGHGIAADLRTGSAESLPYPDRSMDSVVCISVLEFVDDLDAAAAELRRVVADSGRLVVVTPGRSRLLDLGLRLLTGHRADDTFRHRREQILAALTEHFRIERTRSFPRRAPRFAQLYTAARLT